MTRGRIALTRPVGARFAECELTHLGRSPIDVALARRQHAAYEEALGQAGCRVVRLPDLPGHPDGVFVEDTLLGLDDVAIVTRPGAASRRGETVGLDRLVAPFRRVLSMEGPGTLDGGDVLRIGRTLYVGLTPRTSETGIRELERLVTPFGHAVRPIPVTGCLHLKSAVTLVRDGLLLANPEWVDPGRIGGHQVLTVDPDEPHAANVLAVGDTVIAPSGYPATLARLRAAGVRVLPVDLGEFAKAEGGATCCSVLLAVA